MFWPHAAHQRGGSAGIGCWRPFAAVVLLASEGASNGFAPLLDEAA